MSDKNEETALIIAQSGPLNGQRWAVRESLLLGREAECDIVIPDRQISRQHARLSHKGEGVWLEDLDSKNGTHVNGSLVTEPITLQDGDVIQVALAQKFIFLSSDATLPLDPLGAKEPTEFVYQKPGDLKMGSDNLKPKPRKEGRLRLDKRSRRVWIEIGEINRAGMEGTRKPHYHDYEIDPPLSASQYRLLEVLYDKQGQVISRQDLILGVWGMEEAVGVSEQALDALVRRLRDRLASIDPSHAFIITVRGHGLRLDNPPR